MHQMLLTPPLGILRVRNNATNKMPFSTNAASFVWHQYERIQLKQKPNNHFIDLNSKRYSTDALALIEILKSHCLYHALTATKLVPENYITQF